MSGEARFEIAATRAEVSAFSDRFEEYCTHAGVPAAVVPAFQIAFDELLTNAITHAFGSEATTRRIEVVLHRHADGLEAEIIDDGRPFDPTGDAPAPDLDASIEDRAIGGLGIHLVNSLMDAVEYRRIGERNHLRLTKHFSH